MHPSTPSTSSPPSLTESYIVQPTSEAACKVPSDSESNRSMQHCTTPIPTAPIRDLGSTQFEPRNGYKNSSAQQQPLLHCSIAPYWDGSVNSRLPHAGNSGPHPASTPWGKCHRLATCRSKCASTVHSAFSCRRIICESESQQRSVCTGTFFLDSIHYSVQSP